MPRHGVFTNPAFSQCTKIGSRSPATRFHQSIKLHGQLQLDIRVNHQGDTAMLAGLQIMKPQVRSWGRPAASAADDASSRLGQSASLITARDECTSDNLTTIMSPLGLGCLGTFPWSGFKSQASRGPRGLLAQSSARQSCTGQQACKLILPKGDHE